MTVIDSKNIKINNLYVQFINPSSEYRPFVYRYWMNGNISKEGAIADLKAMVEVGNGYK